MIEQLRSRRGKAVLKYVVIGITMAMIFGSILLPIINSLTGEDGTKKQEHIITIDGHKIYPREVQQKAIAYHQQIESLRHQLGEQADMLLRMAGYDKDPRDMALNAVINETLLQIAAQNAGLTHFGSHMLQNKITERDFALQYLDPIVDNSMFSKFGVFNTEVLQDKLARLGMSYDDLIAQTEKALQRKLYIDLAGTTVYMPDHEVRASYLQNEAQRTFGYIQFDLKPYIDALRQKGVSNEALRNFFEHENQASHRYWKSEKRSGTYWTFTPDQYGITISDDAVSSYYQKHKPSYVQNPAQVELYHIFLKSSSENRQQVKERAEQIAQELQESPEKFASKAREVSDAEDAENGGYIGFVARRNESYPDKMLKAAFALDADGEVSDPVEVENGFEIVGRHSRKSATYKPQEEVADEIRETLKKQRFKDRFKTDATQARRQENMDDFISRRNGTQHNIPAITEDQAQQPYETVLFNRLNTVGKYAVYLDENTNTGYVVKLTEIEPSYLPPLEDQINQVREDYLQSEAYKQMKSDIEKAQRMTSEQNATLDDVAQQFQKSVSHATVQSEKDTAWSDLKRKGLPTDRMNNMIHEGYAIESTESDHGYIVMLTDLQPLDEESYFDRKPAIRQNIKQSFENQHLQSFIASLHKNATIDYNRDDKNE